MNPATPLETLIEVARRSRDEAAARLGAALTHLREAEAKRETVEGLVADYRARARAAKVIDTVRLANLRAFMDRLETALAQQCAVCAAARERVALARAEFDRTRQRERAYELLLDRRADAARIVEQRAQQKQQDEFALRVHLASLPGA